MRIDRVLDEFRNRFQGIALRERDDADGIPIIANAKLSTVLRFGFHMGAVESAGGAFQVQH